MLQVFWVSYWRYSNVVVWDKQKRYNLTAVRWNWHKKENEGKTRPKNHERCKLERNMGFLEAIAILLFETGKNDTI